MLISEAHQPGAFTYFYLASSSLFSRLTISLSVGMPFTNYFQTIEGPLWSFCWWNCHWCQHGLDVIDATWRYWRHSWYGLEAPVVVEEAHEVLGSLMKTMMPWQRSWSPPLGWHNGTLMKPLYVLWWWWPYIVSGMWWMPLPWNRSLEGSWTYENLRVCNVLNPHIWVLKSC